MEGYEQITLDQWAQWKEDIREKLKETAGNFVYIGYRLKQIRDSGMYGGAEDIFGFAQKEYGLGKSTVSRFIAINEKFSEGGNSLELRSEYRAIGSSKLAEMLTLTDAECRLITEKTTVSQIRELKNFNRQAPEDVEAAEGGGESGPLRSPLQRCIIEYFRGKKEMLDAAMRSIVGNNYKEASEIVSPGGNATFKKGILFLFLYDYKEGVKYKTFGSEDIVLMSWEGFGREMIEVFMPAYSAEGSTYDRFYAAGEKEEEKASEKETVKEEETPKLLNGKGVVATSQQEGKEGEDDVEEMEEEDESEGRDEEDDGEAGETAAEAEPEDDADGAGGEVGAGDVEEDAPGEGEESDIVEHVEENLRNLEKTRQISGYKAGIRSAIQIMQEQYEKQDWTGIIKKAEDIIWRAERIQKAQDEEEEGEWQ